MQTSFCGSCILKEGKVPAHKGCCTWGTTGLTLKKKKKKTDNCSKLRKQEVKNIGNLL